MGNLWSTKRYTIYDNNGLESPCITDEDTGLSVTLQGPDEDAFQEAFGDLWSEQTTNDDMDAKVDKLCASVLKQACAAAVPA